MGKIITNKPIHVNNIQMGLENVWGSPPGLKIQEASGKILQFFMDDAMDQERILLGNPWIFRNSWLIVQPWDRETDPAALDFDHAPTWVQLWGLPPHCKTKQMGRSIGELLGKVDSAEVYEYPGKKLIIKIKVALNVHQPISAGILIRNAKDGTHWIDFRYEKLPLFCFKCGLTGHGENLCYNKGRIIENTTPLGPWLRSNQYGRRIMDAKDKMYHSNPSLGKQFGSYSPPIPASMMEQMAAMKLQDEREATSANSQADTTTQNRTSTAQGQAQTQVHNSSNTDRCGRIMEYQTDNGKRPQLAQAKRQRTDHSATINLGITMEDTIMAGPAEQASQPQ
jgi:hypothetical protein